MSIVVEHDKRRREILEKALDVFIEEGFENTTFQKMADRCGITRTTLYIYFKNKKEIFNYSIKQLLFDVEGDISRVREDETLSAVDKIIRILTEIVERLETNSRLLSVILDYLLHLTRSNADPNYRVRRRTLRLRHILSGIVIDGIKAGEIAPVNIKVADELFYGLIEAAIFRLVVLKRESAGDLKESIILVVRQMAIDRTGILRA
jgi:AcrR family transcriptional regulator